MSSAKTLFIVAREQGAEFVSGCPAAQLLDQ